METRASYILVGSFVLALTAAVFGFAMWLARVEFEAGPRRYAIYFTGSVTGLAVGSPVRYRGVPVGSVTNMRIDPEDVERVLVLVDVAMDTPIRRDTVATLGLQGITGVAYVLLSGGTQTSPPLTPGPDQEVAVIQSKVSGLQAVLDKAPEVFEKALILADRLTRLVDDRNISAIAETLENIRALTETLAERRGTVDSLLTESERTMSSIRVAAEKITTLTTTIQSKADTIENETQVMLSVVRGTAQSIADVADKLDNVVDENRLAIRDFSASGLYELTQFISESRLLVATLTRLSSQIERDPARFFFGDTQKGFEAQ